MSAEQKISSGRAYELDVDAVYDLIRAERDAASHREVRTSKTLGLSNVQAGDLAQARWGLILPPEPLTAQEQQHVQALQPLIQRRTQQIHKDVPIFHYRTGWRYFDFLRDDTYSDHGVVDVGVMDTSIIPYYLCIVGGPDRIPWEFQQYLDSEYAVGRLWFDDAADCAAYVQHLVEYEQAATSPSLNREALFIAPQQPGDTGTATTSQNLVQPLHQWVAENSTLTATPLIGAGATKDNLLRRLKNQSLNGQPGQLAPAVLLAASHGVEYLPNEVTYDTQAATEGALLMQEWSGDWHMLQPQSYVEGGDISADVQLSGLFAFLFACFSGGSPQMEDWIPPGSAQPARQRAPKPFAARLPQKLLSHGALICVAHVSRVWNYSFLGARLQKQQLGNFRDLLRAALNGDPIGFATDAMNLRWIRITQQLDDMLGDPATYSRKDVADTWMVRNDYRGYVIFGDPAARLRLSAIKN